MLPITCNIRTSVYLTCSITIIAFILQPLILKHEAATNPFVEVSQLTVCNLREGHCINLIGLIIHVCSYAVYPKLRKEYR
jgi:hypothetical protein